MAPSHGPLPAAPGSPVPVSVAANVRVGRAAARISSGQPTRPGSASLDDTLRNSCDGSAEREPLRQGVFRQVSEVELLKVLLQLETHWGWGVRETRERLPRFVSVASRPSVCFVGSRPGNLRGRCTVCVVQARAMV